MTANLATKRAHNIILFLFFLLVSLAFITVLSPVTHAALPEDKYSLRKPDGTRANANGLDCYISDPTHGDCRASYTAFDVATGDSHQYLNLSTGQIDDSVYDSGYLGANYSYFSVITGRNCSTSSTACNTSLSLDLVNRGIGKLACDNYQLEFDYYNPRSVASLGGNTISINNCGTTPPISTIPNSTFTQVIENGQSTGRWKSLVRIKINPSSDNRQASFHLRTSSSNTTIGYAGRIPDTANGEVARPETYAGWVNTYPTNAADGHRVEYTWRPRCDKAAGSSYQIAWDDLDYPSSYQPTRPEVKLWRVDAAGNRIDSAPIDTFFAGSGYHQENISMTPNMYSSPGRPYALTLEFSGIRGGNGISFFQPFDSNLSKLDCPGPQTPSGSVGGACSSTTAKNGNGSGGGEYYTTPGGKTYKTNTLVTIDNVSPAVSSGYTNSGGGYGNGQVGFGATKSWSYTPTAASITISSKLIYHNTNTGNWGTVPGSQKAQTVTCFVAECYVTSVVGDGPGGTVLAGGVAHITIQINNNPSFQPLPASINGQPLGIVINGNQNIPPSAAVGYGIPPGGYGYVYVDVPMPSGATTYSLGSSTWYIGGFQVSPECGTAVSTVGICAGAPCFPTYESFTLQPHAFTTLTPNSENPTNAAYLSYVINPGGRDVWSPLINSSFYVTSPSGGFPCGPVSTSDPNKVWTAGVGSQVLNGSCTPSSVAAGDNYCTEIHLDWTTGLVGPGGPYDIIPTNDPPPVVDCKIVHNKPFFKVYGSTVSSGGDFSVDNPACNSPGDLGSWYNNAGGNYGASSRLGAIALSNIKGFASGQGSASGPPRALTFANTGPPGGAIAPPDVVDPPLGGIYGGTHCLTLPDEPDEAAANDPGASVVNVGTLSGAYKRNGNLALNGGAIGPGRNISIFVEGDVHIRQNISYAGSWIYNASGTTVPSFVLVATGNIYIDNAVTQLDGSYVAHKSSPTAGGTIYTCANSSGNGPMAKNDLYDNCNNQLTVNGAFTAVKINNMRTMGSLRDEGPSGSGSCSNPGIQRSPETCAAEVYKFSPEMQLTLPVLRPPNNGATQYQAITSLPPVL